MNTISGKLHDLGGGFIVRRVLPSSSRQGIGPFLFFDHFGPVDVEPGANHDVRPHPHIGLATVTYLFEGAMVHRDSLGSVQRIEPGAINWMTAGRGIVHSERAPDDLRPIRHRLHGLQLWAALPETHEETDPVFAHYPGARLPQVRLPGIDARVLIGRAFGAESPVATFADTLYVDVDAQAGASLDLGPIAAERAIFPAEGELRVGGASLAVHDGRARGRRDGADRSARGRALRDHRRRADRGSSPYGVELRVVARRAHRAGEARLVGAANGHGAGRDGMDSPALTSSQPAGNDAASERAESNAQC